MTNDPYSQQPPRYPPQQPPSQPYQPQPPYYPGGFPREAVTTRGEMGQPERIAWAIAVMCTLGLALPFYLARKRTLRRTTVTRYR
jgi:hypothetical protein